MWRTSARTVKSSSASSSYASTAITWHHSRPSAGRVEVRPGTSPTRWYTTQDSVPHVGYVGTDGLIHECFFRTG